MALQFQHKVAESQPETEPRQTSLVPSPLSNQVIRALDRRVQQEAMALVASLAKQMAKDAWQADLDIFRIGQAQRVGLETFVTSSEAIASLDSCAERLISKHPELEADIRLMAQQQFEIIKQFPRIGTVGYLRRYHKVDC